MNRAMAALRATVAKINVSLSLVIIPFHRRGVSECRSADLSPAVGHPAISHPAVRHTDRQTRIPRCIYSVFLGNYPILALLQFADQAVCPHNLVTFQDGVLKG